ncbi:hypothetical protein QBC32DRAFT_103560 [Pseudoneurospora amorphoporcata]|uniref:Uncharacterized protein n=1 Tax=Pseudoneurospora amorphoporcata TaxID=241081 RepID=A0AAN6SGX8_9PEZI|nr:hypothetical protein QBC32DRAFT_103560 [Pseudoneurospora amorphoporcata]
MLSIILPTFEAVFVQFTFFMAAFLGGVLGAWRYLPGCRAFYGRLSHMQVLYGRREGSSGLSVSGCSSPRVSFERVLSGGLADLFHFFLDHSNYVPSLHNLTSSTSLCGCILSPRDFLRSCRLVGFIPCCIAITPPPR